MQVMIYLNVFPTFGTGIVNGEIGSHQSSGRRRRTMARRCEPRLGISIQGRMRNLGLSTTSGRFFSRSCGVHPMKLSRGASFQAAVPSRAWRWACRRGRGRRSASGRRPGSCGRDSDGGRRTRSTACPRGCRARRCAGRAGAPRQALSAPGTAAVRCPARRRWARAGSAVTSAAAG